jgi:hypothetical protein
MLYHLQKNLFLFFMELRIEYEIRRALQIEK